MQSYIKRFEDLRKTAMHFAVIPLALLIGGCDQESIGESPDTIRIQPGNDSEWHFHGLDQNETRHSPLVTINKSNVSQLGLAWSTPLRSTRGLEATPIVKDGIIILQAKGL